MYTTTARAEGREMRLLKKEMRRRVRERMIQEQIARLNMARLHAIMRSSSAGRYRRR